MIPAGRDAFPQVKFTSAWKSPGGPGCGKLENGTVPDPEWSLKLQPVAAEECTPKVKMKNSTIAQPEQTSSSRVIKFRVGKEHLRKFEFPNGEDIVIYHIYPTLADWVGKAMPDDVNPRSHDLEVIHSAVARDIKNTIRSKPEDFFLANRGATVVAEDLRFDPTREEVQITIADPELHGLADGATSDAVVELVQREIAGSRKFTDLVFEEIPDYLKRARLHVEVIVGLSSRDRIGMLAQGRNTSRQVKSWSLADFQGAFDWIRDILEAPQSKFQGRVGYEENAGKEINILDVISLMTLFSREWDDKGAGLKRKAPTVAYSSKGRMDTRLQDPSLAPYYQALAPILEDILRLHDYVYARFEGAYKEAMGGGKLGRRRGVESRPNNPIVLPLTGSKSNYDIPNGYIFPLLASFRALVEYVEEGKAKWKSNPFKFFDDSGPELLQVLIEQIDNLGGVPQLAGKSRAVYTSLHDRAKLLVAEAKA